MYILKHFIFFHHFLYELIVWWNIHTLKSCIYSQYLLVYWVVYGCFDAYNFITADDDKFENEMDLDDVMFQFREEEDK